jgi:hypothetical protein
MTHENDGGPAFPGGAVVMHADGYARSVPPRDGGMSLRDWFAGHALSGLLMSHPYMHRDNEFRKARVLGLANQSYQIADAMLVAREKDRT